MSAHWLFKTEPSEFSIHDLQQKGCAVWDGIRNYKARNYLRDAVKTGDTVLVYHSSCALVGVVGVGRIAKCAYPDPAQFNPQSRYFDAKSNPANPRWFCVDLAFESLLAKPIPLALIKQHQPLHDLLLLKQPRLSVSPVTAEQFAQLMALV